jgi:hypothetical protein
LRETGVIFQTILADFPGEEVSQDGMFVARADGIYLLEFCEKAAKSSAEKTAH